MRVDIGLATSLRGLIELFWMYMFCHHLIPPLNSKIAMHVVDLDFVSNPQKAEGCVLSGFNHLNLNNDKSCFIS